MSAEHENLQPDQDMFAQTRQDTARLAALAQQLEDQRFQSGETTTADIAELPYLKHQVEHELTEHDAGDRMLGAAADAVTEIHNSAIQDRVKTALVEGYGLRQNIALAHDMAGTIGDRVSRIEALSRLESATGFDSVRQDLDAATTSVGDTDIDLTLARSILHAYRQEGRFDDGQAFMDRVGTAVEHSTRPPQVSDLPVPPQNKPFAEGYMGMIPTEPEPAWQIKARALTEAAKLNPTVLNELRAQIQTEPDTAIRNELLAAYALATVQRANDSLSPDQTAA